MTLRIAILRDPIEGSRPGETSHFLAREAQARGHAVWYFTPADLRWETPNVVATARSLRYDGARMELGAPVDLDLATMDVVLVRHDPPVDLAWLLPTWILEQLPSRVVVANPARALRDTPDKLVLLALPHLAPPTLVTSDRARIRAFRSVHGDVVLKPLFDKAGTGVSVFMRDEPGFDDALEQLAGERSSLPTPATPIMVQRWQPESLDGPVRVMVVDGRVCGALRSVPRDGDRVVGLDRSRAVVAHTLDAAQRATAEEAAALLASRGIVLAGLDLVGPWLIEANVTSAGGEVYYDQVWSSPLAPSIWDALERSVGARAAAGAAGAAGTTRSTSGASPMTSDFVHATSAAP